MFILIIRPPGWESKRCLLPSIPLATVYLFLLVLTQMRTAYHVNYTQPSWDRQSP